MIRCRTFKRLCAVTGQRSAILLVLLLALALFATPLTSQAAAFQCKTVFIKTELFNLAHYEEALENLAKMKLKVDSNLANGSHSPAETSFNAAFKEKFQEVLHAANGKIDEKQLRMLVAEKIQKLQGIKKEEIEEEQIARVQLRDLLPFDKVSGARVESSAFRDFQFTSENQNFLFYSDSISFSFFNIKTQEAKSLRALSSTVLGNDRILFFDDTATRVYDIATDTVKPYEVAQIKNFDKLEASPSKEWIADYNESQLNIFNEHTGMTSPASFAFPKLSLLGLLTQRAPTIRSVQFINDSEVLILTKKHLYKFNFQTGQNTKITYTSHYDFLYEGIETMEISPDQNSVLLKDFRDKFFYLEIKDLADINIKARKLGGLADAQIRYFKFTPDSKGVALVTHGEIQSYDLETQISSKFLIDGIEMKQNIPMILPLQTQDKKTTFIVRRVDGQTTGGTPTREYFIETWRRGGDVYK